MDPTVATAIIATATVAAIIVIGYMIHHSEPLPLTADEWAIINEREFKRYVEREIYKAQHGAANTAPWAVQLLAVWDERVRRQR